MDLFLRLGQQDIFPGSGELVAADFFECLRLPSPHPGAGCVETGGVCRMRQ